MAEETSPEKDGRLAGGFEHYRFPVIRPDIGRALSVDDSVSSTPQYSQPHPYSPWKVVYEPRWRRWGRWIWRFLTPFLNRRRARQRREGNVCTLYGGER